MYCFFQVNTIEKVKFDLTNITEQSLEIELFFDETVDPHIVAFSNEKCCLSFCLYSHFLHFIVSLPAGESKTIEFNITMICTARIDSSIVVVSHGRGYCNLPFHSESSPSCFFSLEEITLGKMLGKGSYAIFP